MMNRQERILLHSNNLWVFADGMFGPLYALFTQRIGGDILDVSYGWAIYLIVTGCCILLIGRLSDGYDKKKLLVMGYALTAICTFGYLFVKTPVHLFIVQAGLGVSLALVNPAWYSLYAKYEDRKRSGFAWGLFDGESKIIGGLAILTGGFLIKYVSFEWLFVAMGTFHILAAIVQARMIKMKP